MEQRCFARWGRSRRQVAGGCRAETGSVRWRHRSPAARQPQREGGELVACAFDEAGILMPGGAGFTSAFAVDFWVSVGFLASVMKLHGSLVQATGALEPRESSWVVAADRRARAGRPAETRGVRLDLPEIGSFQDGSCRRRNLVRLLWSSSSGSQVNPSRSRQASARRMAQQIQLHRPGVIAIRGQFEVAEAELDGSNSAVDASCDAVAGIAQWPRCEHQGSRVRSKGLHRWGIDPVLPRCSRPAGNSSKPQPLDAIGAPIKRGRPAERCCLEEFCQGVAASGWEPGVSARSTDRGR